MPVVPRRIQLSAHSFLTSLTSLSFSLFIAGCHVGPTTPGLGDEEPDGSSVTPGIDAGGTTQDCTALETDVTDDGNHPIGYEFTASGNQGCSTTSCHQNNLGPAWTVAGSVYRGLTSEEPVVGAHIFITDADGKEVHLTTAQNGFFYTIEALTPPLTTYASGCPDELEMVTTAVSGSCNAANCHDNDFRIYLPGEG